MAFLSGAFYDPAFTVWQTVTGTYYATTGSMYATFTGATYFASSNDLLATSGITVSNTTNITFVSGNYLKLAGGTLTGGLQGTSGFFTSMTGTNVSGTTGVLGTLNALTSVTTPLITPTTVSATNITGTNISGTQLATNNLWVALPIYAQIGMTGNTVNQLAAQNTVQALSGTWINIGASSHFTVALGPVSAGAAPGISYTAVTGIIGCVIANASMQNTSAVTQTGTFGIFKNGSLIANTTIQAVTPSNISGIATVTTQYVGAIANNDKFQACWTNNSTATAMRATQANISVYRIA